MHLCTRTSKTSEHQTVRQMTRGADQTCQMSTGAQQTHLGTKTSKTGEYDMDIDRGTADALRQKDVQDK